MRLHVLNGDAVREKLEQSAIAGTFSVWVDVLHDGPCLLLPPDEWRRLRSRHLSSSGFGTEAEILAQYERADAELERAGDYEEVIFWFEHDLFDQLLLIRHLHWLSSRPSTAGRFSLLCIGSFPGVPDFVGLGQLTPSQLESLLDARHGVTPGELTVGTRAWAAFCAPTPGPLTALLSESTAALPFLQGAIRRFLEDYPAPATGLSRSERQILETVAAGVSGPMDVFHATQKMEERIFMGDASWWIIAVALAMAPHPLLEIDADAARATLPRGEMRLTQTGRDVLAGRADHVVLNGIDRWMGGVHLTDGRWRWDGVVITSAQ